ncbi:uncharacterized protein LOC126322615 [Schistocerca gregaria]|uniref:uncharacterized protein LOC126322615 n=1 Tax=Schistocerca gregaria TaxID=7010 RepID=UPI00211F44D3|nr:uncharacterized protein LOC126322615 [Schistocerca gregaria]
MAQQGTGSPGKVASVVPNTNIFGVPLHQVMQMEEGRTVMEEQKIPTVLDMIFCSLEAQAMDAEVLVQADPEDKEVEILRTEICGGQIPLLNELKIETLAGLLMRYFLELPEPIVPPVYYQKVRGIVFNYFSRRQKLVGIRKLQKIFRAPSFPQVNACILYRLLSFFNKLSSSWWSDACFYERVIEKFVPFVLRNDKLTRREMSSPSERDVDAMMVLVENYEEILGGCGAGSESEERRKMMIARGGMASVSSFFNREREMEIKVEQALKEAEMRSRVEVVTIRELRRDMEEHRRSTDERIAGIKRSVKAIEREVNEIKVMLQGYERSD